MTDQTPFGCRWCGTERSSHGQRWTHGVSVHGNSSSRRRASASRPEPEAIPARTEHRSPPKVRWWGVTVPTTGEYLVRNGKVMPVLESEFMDFNEEPWWTRLRIRLRWAKEALFDDVG